MANFVWCVAVLSLPAIFALAPSTGEKEPPPLRDAHDDSGYVMQKVSVPVSYNLYLDITNYDFYSYTGTVEILMRYTGEGNQFYLNSAGVVIDEESVTVTRSDGSNLPVSNIVYMDQYEQIYFGFAERLQTGDNYRIKIDFSNSIGTELKGLYRSSYLIGNTTRYLATTHFEATYARTVFPCYDEPSYKATFNVQIRHRSEYTALSNMPAIDKVQEGDYTVTTFGTTPLMSTYLLAFVVSDFKTLSEEADRFRVFAAEHKVAHTGYALEFLGKSLRSLETFFGHQYQLPKVDLIAIPDFAMGAMENWGLITFREQYLIFEEDVTTARTKQNIADLITHELTHMWFGNEVTPEWWTYVWLSEGFARYFEYYITSQLEPTWNLWEQFIVTNVHSALSQDCHTNNRPMSYYATEPTVLNGLFDYVVYAKSASVIRMVQNVIGFETFKMALNDYIRSRSYLTTVPQYLYTSIEKFRTVDLPSSVEAIFESWANAPGYPLVTVTIDWSERKLTATQKRFWMPIEDESPPPNQLFFVPLNYATNLASSEDMDSTAATFWLTPSTPETTINIADDISMIFINKQQTGYYRVNYDKQSWEQLINVLNSDQFEERIPVINRAQLVDDVANLARAGEISYDVALSLMQYLERETEYIPWSTAYNALLHLDRMYSGQEGYSRFETFVRTITSCMYENVRLVGLNDHISRLHRGNTVYLACYSGVQACLDDATTQIQASIENPSFKVPEEAQAAVFCALHKHRLPVEPDYQMTWFEKQFLAQDSSELDVELINRYLTSVGCSRNETILEYFLSLTNFNYPGLPITAAMKNQIFVGLANGGPTARMAALRYLSEHFSTVTYLLPNVGPIFTELGNRINVQSERALLQEIVTKYGHTLAAAAKDAADQALVQADQNIRWMQKYASTVTTWLADAMYEGTTTPKPEGGGGGAGRAWSTRALVAAGLVLIVVNTLA